MAVSFSQAGAIRSVVEPYMTEAGRALARKFEESDY
jgi:hypothetical protein